LGAIIERRTGRAFTSVVEEEIFRPLGLTSTRCEIDPARQPALGYTRTPAGGVNTDSARWYPAWEEPKPGDEFIVGSPMGGGYSTMDDLARFAEALVAHQLLGPEITARVLTGYINAGYGGRDGYGFETGLVNGVKIAGHRGSLAGSSNQLEFYPDLGYVLVIVGNTDGGTDAIAAHVRATYIIAAAVVLSWPISVAWRRSVTQTWSSSSSVSPFVVRSTPYAMLPSKPVEDSPRRLGSTSLHVGEPSLNGLDGLRAFTRLSVRLVTLGSTRHDGAPRSSLRRPTPTGFVSRLRSNWSRPEPVRIAPEWPSRLSAT